MGRQMESTAGTSVVPTKVPARNVLRPEKLVVDSAKKYGFLPGLVGINDARSDYWVRYVQ